jgi:hypothetical protein
MIKLKGNEPGTLLSDFVRPASPTSEAGLVDGGVKSSKGQLGSNLHTAPEVDNPCNLPCCAGIYSSVRIR